MVLYLVRARHDGYRGSRSARPQAVNALRTTQTGGSAGKAVGIDLASNAPGSGAVPPSLSRPQGQPPPRLHGPVLEQGAKDADVLVVDRHDSGQAIRLSFRGQAEASIRSRPPHLMGAKQRPDPRRHGDLPYLRQRTMRSPGSPIPRQSRGECQRHGPEGSGCER